LDVRHGQHARDLARAPHDDSPAERHERAPHDHFDDAFLRLDE